MLPADIDPSLRLSKLLIEKMDDAIILTDYHGRVTFCNQSLEILSGLKMGELLGIYIWDFFRRLSVASKATSPLVTALRRRLKALLKNGTPLAEGELVEGNHQTSDGRVLTLEWRFLGIPGEEGWSIAGILRDVTIIHEVRQALNENEQKLRMIIEQADAGILLLDAQGIVVEWNAALELLSGVAREEVLKHPVQDLPRIMVEHVPEGEASRAQAVHQTIMDLMEEARLNPVSSVEGRFTHPDGDERYLSLQQFAIPLTSGQMTECIIRDITQQKKNEQNLRRYTFQLETLRQIGLELSGELSIESLAWMIAPRAIELLAASAMALYLHDPITEVLELAICLGENQPPIERAVRRGQGLAGLVWERGEPILLEDYDGGNLGQLILQKTTWGKVAGSPIVYAGEFMGVLFVFSGKDFISSDLELLGLFASHAGAAIRNARLHTQLHELAIRDPMTEIFNRRHFFELAESAFDQARRYGRPISAIIFDADHYKDVNDTFGHLVGDEVLKQITARCSGVIRQADLFGRYGGEEFVILMPDTGMTGAMRLAERLRLAVGEQPFQTEKGPVPVTISLGVARNKRSTSTLLQLLGDADKAIYRAKAAGRNRIHN